jgi:hypothetical protein
MRENVSYIVTRAYKRHAGTARLSQSATLHSTGNISAEDSVKQEQSRRQEHTWNSKLFVIFPAESTAEHSLHFQHLYVDCGYEFKTPIAKRSLNFSNVHVNILMTI